MYNICSAILAINPSEQVSVNAEDLDQITWHGETAVISKSDIQAKQAELKTAYDAIEYQRLREPKYPLIHDVTVALAEKAEGDSTMWDAISKQRADVKKAHPKP
jgi:putative protein kinase ArgK-like GTPase of G3E family